MSLSGSLVINESTGSTVSKASGSLIIKHQNLNGTSSIVFPSSAPGELGDYGYVKYIDDINNISLESGRLVIGIENDPTGEKTDSIVLMTPESRGYVGINKMSPTCALDVTGDGKISGTLNSGNLGINKTPTCALDVTGDGSISGTLTTNNLTVNGTISGNFTLNNITTGNITNNNNITTDSLLASGYCKIGDESTNINAGVFIAGRTKSYYPIPVNNDKILIKRGVEVFWNTVPDTRNYFRNSNSNYDGLAGDTTFVNYAGGYGQGGYSFQTTAGTGSAITANPTVLFEMINGKDFTINGGLKVSGGSATMDDIKIKNSDNYVKLGFIDNVPVGYMPTSSASLQLYYSSINATSYLNSYPLVIQNFSLSISNYNVQLVFPLPEYIYVNVLSNDVYIVLPYVNQTIGNVNVQTECFRFRIRQMTGGHKMYLTTYSDSLYPTRTGGNIYDFLNNQQSSPCYSGAWYEEVHYYMGNWYVNRIS
jgi:hypothetical protein